MEKITLRQLLMKTKTVDMSIKFCQKWKLLPKKSIQMCTSCTSENSLTWIKDAQNKFCPYRIICKMCRVTCSPRTNTWFAGSKLPLSVCLELIYWFVSPVSQSHCAEQLGINKNTVTYHYTMLREVCAIMLQQESKVIGGPGHIVELYESHLYTRKYHRGRLMSSNQQVWIFGGIDRMTRKCFVVRVTRRNRETLFPIIKNYIRAGSLIISDSWKAYETLEEEGYLHEAVNDQVEFVREDGPRMRTQTNERMWRSLKESIGSAGRKTPAIDKLRLAEFIYYKTRDVKTAATKFFPLLRDIAEVYPGYEKEGLKFRTDDNENDNTIDEPIDHEDVDDDEDDDDDDDDYDNTDNDDDENYLLDDI